MSSIDCGECVEADLSARLSVAGGRFSDGYAVARLAPYEQRDQGVARRPGGRPHMPRRFGQLLVS